MRVHDNPLEPDETLAWFVSDTPDGPVVCCGNCDTETLARDWCPGCKKWFVYRPYLEW